MKLLHAIKSSIYDPAFYRGVLEKPLRSSFAYFFSLAVLLSLISAVVFSFSAVPAAHSFLNSLGGKILNYYPDGLEVTIKDGRASTNVREPYRLPVPDEIKHSNNFAGENPDTESLLVIDTKNEFTITQFESDKTLALLTRKAIVYKDDHGKITIQPLDRIPDTTITKELVSQFVGKAQPILNSAVFLLPVLIFLGLGFLYGVLLVYLLFGALLVWLVAKMKKINIKYVEAYQITLHAATAGILFDWFASTFVAQAPIPFVFTVLLVMVAWCNLGKEAQA